MKEKHTQPQIIAHGAVTNYNIDIHDNHFQGGLHLSDIAAQAAKATEAIGKAEEESAPGEQPVRGMLSQVALRPYMVAGMLTEELQPEAWMSNGEKALLAHDIAERLELRNFWKIFEDLWGIKYLRTYYTRFCNSPKAEEMIFRLHNIK